MRYDLADAQKWTGLYKERYQFPPPPKRGWFGGRHINLAILAFLMFLDLVLAFYGCSCLLGQVWNTCSL